MLGGFADAHLATLSEAELDEFERILAEPDQELFPVLISREPAPPALDGPVMRRLRTLAHMGGGRAAPGAED